MKTYAIGDVQGCLRPLQQLLQKINYDQGQDTLWFAGDLINRGSHSLETLRFIKSLPRTICVLGNHDLALLAIAEGFIRPQPQDTFQEILFAPDKQELLSWLRQQRILHHDPDLRFTLTHAGIFPLWDLKQAIKHAQELEQVLRGPLYRQFLQNMYGNHPTQWHDSLQGWERLRFITNAFTRMRFCTPQGALDFSVTGTLAQHPQHIPWFAFPKRATQQERLLFGHWAALEARCEVAHVYPLDSGCVWGKCLTAFCLQTHKRTKVSCA